MNPFTGKNIVYLVCGVTSLVNSLTHNARLTQLAAEDACKKTALLGHLLPYQVSLSANPKQGVGLRTTNSIDLAVVNQGLKRKEAVAFRAAIVPSPLGIDYSIEKVYPNLGSFCNKDGTLNPGTKAFDFKFQSMTEAQANQQKIINLRKKGTDATSVEINQLAPKISEW
jgi:hypothetical protein